VLEICEIGEQGGLVAASVMLVCPIPAGRDKTLIFAVINSSTSLMNSRPRMVASGH
jgi:hypothetical protein